ncbi:methionine--tRNA ligase [candidate division LCP-89 bacterium B3_LCP]|uniref:Methionine--tRNA ligase n=1 Tax=candidate division LCP-89 bacterium B3_LCP TaxID=2012998 RepID=A0A532V4T1_UNCL8|nr:MAG: methionine--tRNA ligase [candidate division LCP-89 bacterium B3_LCP]
MNIMSGKFYITTPIYYVNAEPHLGHAYSSVIADVFARYHRLFGDDTFFLTGTDEHGQKVAEAAAEAGRTPLAHCDLMVQRYKNVWEKLNIGNDDFIRTTEERHSVRVQEILQRLWDAGEIYEDEYEGWYCVPEERFWTEKDISQGNCPSCGREVTRLTEKNYFFRMGKYQDWLINHIKQNPRFILPETRRNEILGFLNQPLGDLCISRPVERLSWGIPLPFNDKFVVYVWFDALFNYYTAPQSRGEDWWPASVHLIGKDILTTHCVYWPTMLKAADLELPETIFATGWWLFNQVKMSKSLGNVVEPLAMVDKYGADAFRFFLCREMSLGQDASFSEEALVKRYNSELANDLGNLYSRLLKLVHTYCEGKIPSRESNENGKEKRGIDIARPFLASARLHIDEFELNSALNIHMAYVRGINKFVEDTAPWKTGKTDPEGTRYNLRIALEDLATAAYSLWPIMPDKMGEILRTLGIEDPLNIPEDTVAMSLPDGYAIPEKAALFPRIKLEIPKVPETPDIKSVDNLVSIDDFRKTKIQIAKILSASPAPKSDKLLILEVDLGDEKRQLVAGIAEHYQPETLIGKSVVIVTNLKPAKIRGIESNGMLLAADDNGKPVIIVPDDETTPGSVIS